MDFLNVLFNIACLIEIAHAVHISSSNQRVVPKSSNLAISARGRSSELSWPNAITLPSLWSLSSRYGGTARKVKRRILPASYSKVRARGSLSRGQRLNLVASQLLRQTILRRVSADTLRNSVITATDWRTNSFPNSRLAPPTSVDVTRNNIMENRVANEHSQGPLMLLLNSRERSNRTADDEKVIGRHLLVLGAIRSGSSTGGDSIIQKQLEYIERIVDTAIRRETLKLFVKDMVDRSGFLAPTTDQNIIDTTDLMALLDRISEIHARFNDRPVDTGISISGETLVNSIQTPTTTDSSSISVQTDRNAISRTRISNALGAYKLNPRQKVGPDVSTFQNELSTFKSRWNAINSRHGSGSGVNKTPMATKRDRIRMMVGKSIYGDKFVPSLRPSTPASTTTSETMTTDSVRKREPVGGTGDYWAHLRVGLADLLCRLCQQRQNEACIIRYCNNDS